MNNIKSIIKSVVFFTVTAVLFAPAPSLGEENPESRIASQAHGFYHLPGDGDSALFAFTLPVGSEPIRVSFFSASGKSLLDDPIIVDPGPTPRTSKSELLIFVTPTIVVENNGNGLILTDPEGAVFNLTSPNEKPEFSAIITSSIRGAPIIAAPPYAPDAVSGSTTATGSLTVTIREVNPYSVDTMVIKQVGSFQGFCHEQGPNCGQ